MLLLLCLHISVDAGDKFWNQFYLAPVRDENDCVSHYIGIQSDVTDLMHQAETLDATGSLSADHSIALAGPLVTGNKAWHKQLHHFSDLLT